MTVSSREGVRARLVWVVDGEEQGTQLLVEVLPAALEEGRLEVPDGEGAPAGAYSLLSEDRALAINPNDPIPVFLHEDFRSLEKAWSQPLPDRAQEAAVADEVYRTVRDLVERELPSGARPIGPTFTMSYTDLKGRDHVRGVCVLARRRSEKIALV